MARSSRSVEPLFVSEGPRRRRRPDRQASVQLRTRIVLSRTHYWHSSSSPACRPDARAAGVGDGSKRPGGKGGGYLHLERVSAQIVRRRIGPLTVDAHLVSAVDLDLHAIFLRVAVQRTSDRSRIVTWVAGSIDARLEFARPDRHLEWTVGMVTTNRAVSERTDGVLPGNLVARRFRRVLQSDIPIIRIRLTDRRGVVRRWVGGVGRRVGVGRRIIGKPGTR